MTSPCVPCEMRDTITQEVSSSEQNAEPQAFSLCTHDDALRAARQSILGNGDSAAFDANQGVGVVKVGQRGLAEAPCLFGIVLRRVDNHRVLPGWSRDGLCPAGG